MLLVVLGELCNQFIGDVVMSSGQVITKLPNNLADFLVGNHGEGIRCCFVLFYEVRRDVGGVG